MTMPVVDVLGRAGVADDKTGVILPVYPQSGKAEVFTWQLRTLVGEALAKCVRARVRRSRRRQPASVLDRHDLVDRTARDAARSTVPSRWPRQRGRVTPADVRRVPADAGGPRRAQARARGRGVGDPPHGRRPARAAQFLAQLPFALTDDQQQAIAEITHDMAGDGADAPAAPGRRRVGQDRRRARGARSSRCRAATRARSWRPPKCSPSSTISAR